MMNNKKVVTIGGGTGTYAVLTGLKKYDNLDLSAVVAVTDSGGSTGKLRDEFGYLPVGDIRQCIVALAEEGNGDNLLRDLFNYRFQKGGAGLEGHSFGNLFLTAMTDILGDEEKAIEYSSKILRIKGQVIPVSLNHADVVVEQKDGTVIVGETEIKDKYQRRDIDSRIERVWLQPKAEATPHAIEAIKEADLIVIGPGGLYTSLIANLIVEGIQESILSSDAKILFNMNLMTDAGQTHGFTASDHLRTITEYLGKKPDYIVMNDAKLPEDILEKYKKVNDFPVKDDIDQLDGVKIIKENLISGSEEIKKKKDFGAKRSLIRHDSYRIAEIIVEDILK
jgi:uncharacterized cofD-like protein